MMPPHSHEMDEKAPVNQLLCGTATRTVLYVVSTQESIAMPGQKLDLLQGTLDTMVLQTLSGLGPLHGYGIARRIEQISGDQVLLNQGTIYASLVRLQQRRWITAQWGVSENNRKAKFYSITRKGRKQLAADADHWLRLADVMERLLSLVPNRRSQ
jgi:transcriptional regulator